jgi:hypothetical protein
VVGSVGNFDTKLTIDDRGHVLPAGTLEVDPGHVVQKMYIWIIQMRGADRGAAAAGFQDQAGLSLSTERWTTRADVVNDGVFEEGIAIGMALAIVQETATQTNKVRWWSETVKLEKSP